MNENEHNGIENQDVSQQPGREAETPAKKVVVTKVGKGLGQSESQGSGTPEPVLSSEQPETAEAAETVEAAPVQDQPDQEQPKPKRKRSIKGILTNVLIIGVFGLVFFIGAVVMFYPNISNYINQKNQSRAVAGYQQVVDNLDKIDYESYLDAAREYNARLANNGVSVAMTLSMEGVDEDRTSDYWNLLSIDGSNIMGYIVIDILDMEVPLYHGVGDVVLAQGAGHLQGTSLPVGGESSHTVVSAHTGLPSAKFFDGVDSLKEGDTFALRVMNEVLTYEIDQILVVLPEEIDALAIEPGEDYATLVTCTPYGINSHRLLVRGHRIETPPEKLVESTKEEVIQEEPGFFARAKDSVVAGLSAVVETVATGIVRFAEWGMDIFGVEY